MKLAEILIGAEFWGQGHPYRNQRLCRPAGMDRLVWLEGGAWSLDGGPATLLRARPHWYVLTIRQEKGRLLDVIAEVTGARPASLSAWNDAQERTWAEVAEIVTAYDAARMLAHGAKEVISES